MKKIILLTTAAALMLAFSGAQAETDRTATFDRCIKAPAGASLEQLAGAPTCFQLAAASPRRGHALGCRIVSLICGGVQHYANRCNGGFYLATNPAIPYPMGNEHWTRCTGWADHLIDFSRCTRDRGICERQIHPLP